MQQTMNITSSDVARTEHTRPQVRLRLMLLVLLVLSPVGAWNLWAFGKVMRGATPCRESTGWADKYT